MSEQRIGPSSSFSQNILRQKYADELSSGVFESWQQVAHRVVRSVMAATPAEEKLISEIEQAVMEMKFLPGGRYLKSAGKRYHQVQNCLLLRAHDSREGWADLLRRGTLALMTGAGIGVNYSGIRASGREARRTAGKSRGPLALAQAMNEAGRQIVSPGDRRSAIWAGLNWAHPDIFSFVTMKDWSPDVVALKAKDSDFPATMDGTNISVCLDDKFFHAMRNSIHPMHAHARAVYDLTVRQMLRTAEPGFSIDVGKHSGEDLRNACTEICSADDSDICNLGSINMARIESEEEMLRVVRLGTIFLLAGTMYSDVPYYEVDHTRTKNRRLGLGLMGIHEWLLKRGHRYGMCEELKRYLHLYTKSTWYAMTTSEEWGITEPVATRAIAPTGTIGILAETTTGIEPIFCVAYKRRYVKGDTIHYQYVVDPTAKRLIDSGVKVADIEDALSLASDVERRVRFQAEVQEFVDHGISSTINLPAWGSELNNETSAVVFGEMLLKYLPSLRGITCYPDGARSGQPLTPVDYELAMRHEGEVFLESADVCEITKAGSCG